MLLKNKTIFEPIMNGFIKLHRQLLDWEWYSDNNTFRVFIHCLLKANYKEKNWKGITIKRGQFVTSTSNLSIELGLSVNKIRLSLTKLKQTKEITIKTTNKNTLVTLVNFDTYQDVETENHKQNNKQTTNKPQSKHKQTTTTKERKNIKNSKNTIRKKVNQKKKEFDFGNLSANFIEKINEFMLYRAEIKKPFKSDRSIQQKINSLKKEVAEHGEQIVIESINLSIENGYQGTSVKWLKKDDYEKQQTDRNIYEQIADFIDGDIKQDAGTKLSDTIDIEFEEQ